MVAVELPEELEGPHFFRPCRMIFGSRGALAHWVHREEAVLLHRDGPLAHWAGVHWEGAVLLERDGPLAHWEGPVLLERDGPLAHWVHREEAVLLHRDGPLARWEGAVLLERDGPLAHRAIPSHRDSPPHPSIRIIHGIS